MAKCVKATGVKATVKKVAKVKSENGAAGAAVAANEQMRIACGSDKLASHETLSKEGKRLMQPAGCRTYMRRRLAKEFPEIVDGFVEEAKKGSCPHVKQAMEMLKPVRKGTTRKKGTAARLLEELSRER